MAVTPPTGEFRNPDVRVVESADTEGTGTRTGGPQTYGEDIMGQAREVMDQLTAAALDQHSVDSAMSFYAEDAVLITPDAGEIRGRSNIADYWRPMIEGFSDSRYESLHKSEDGDVAIDEGWFIGTNTAPLPMPDGGTLPPTGRQVKLRSCDIATVQGNKIKEHHLYFDQMEFMGQLGLTPG
jgi:hypothetical protein